MGGAFSEDTLGQQSDNSFRSQRLRCLHFIDPTVADWIRSLKVLAAARSHAAAEPTTSAMQSSDADNATLYGLLRLRFNDEVFLKSLSAVHMLMCHVR